MTDSLPTCERYDSPDYPCTGVQLVGWQDTTRFLPWYYDGQVVRWGFACETRSEAHAVAAEMAMLS